MEYADEIVSFHIEAIVYLYVSYELYVGYCGLLGALHKLNVIPFGFLGLLPAVLAQWESDVSAICNST